MSGSDLCIPRNETVKLRFIYSQDRFARQTDPGNIQIAHRYMNVGRTVSFLGIHKFSVQCIGGRLKDWKGERRGVKGTQD